MTASMTASIIYDPVEDSTHHDGAESHRILRGVPCPRCGRGQTVAAPHGNSPVTYWLVSSFVCTHCAALVKVVVDDDGKWRLSEIASRGHRKATQGIESNRHEGGVGTAP